MKRLTFSITLAGLALFATSCGGGGSNVGPPPPPPITGGFSNASLNGHYAFSMSGNDSNGFFARIGSITANGQGLITEGVEDINDSVGVARIIFTGGTYSIGGDGRGSLQLVNSTGTTHYSISLGSTSKGYIIETDTFATAGGSLAKQDTTAFLFQGNALAPGIAGGYVFDVSGIDNGGVPESIVGRFTADGAGNVSGGVMDENLSGSVPSGAMRFASASYGVDSVNTVDLPSFGRGVFNLASNTFVFYIVDGTRVFFLGTNVPAVLSGEADAQQSMTFDNTSLIQNQSYAYSIGGAGPPSSGMFGPIAAAGRFTADGSGNLRAITLDENDSGGLTQVTNESGAYSVDTSGLSAGSGRGTATFNNSTGMFTFVFYLMSPTQAVFQETDSGIVSDGVFQAQAPGPFTASSLAGDYAFRWNAVDTNGEDDFVGRLTLTSAGVPSGGVDFNESGQVFLSYPFNGTLALAPDSTGANTFSITTTPSPTNTLNFTLYIVNPTQSFVVGTDPQIVAGGVMSGQQH